MRTRFFIVATLLLCTHAAAKASTVYFTYTGTSSTGVTDTLSFTLPSPAYPFEVDDPTDFSVGISSPGSVDGSALDNAVAIFMTSGGVFVDGVTEQNAPVFEHFTFYLESGPSLFSGDIYNPTFDLGTFNLSGSLILQNLNPGPSADRDTSGILTISTTAPTVTPEPSSILLLSTGLLGVAGMLRRKPSWVSHLHAASSRRGGVTRHHPPQHATAQLHPAPRYT